MSSFQSLEARFIQAMEQIAALSLDKEQLEHLVDRLQDETGEWPGLVMCSSWKFLNHREEAPIY